MNLLSRLRLWYRRRRRERAASKSSGTPLREFVYLDDVSVYSLTASRLGSIATEFTDTEAKSLAAEVESSVEATSGFAKGRFGARTSTSREQSSQVLRKSIIQSAFKDLYELEVDRLALRPPLGQPPKVTSPTDIESRGGDGSWVVDPKMLTRGELIEVEVQLGAEAVFRVNAVVGALLEILQEDLELFGVSTPTGIGEVRAINRVLDRLLTGLVPVRGTAVDFSVAEIGGRELIVHREVLSQLPDRAHLTERPLVVVGVAEQRLFWRDIRRVLFSDARYRVLSRVSQAGLQDSWSPVKLTEVLKEVMPGVEAQLLGALGETTLGRMGEAIASGSNERRQSEILEAAAVLFARAVAESHDRDVGTPELQKLVEPVVLAGGTLDTLSDRRSFFGSVLARTDEFLGTTTTSAVAVACRSLAVSEVGLGYGGSLAPGAALSETVVTSHLERFLDTEIVAIYW